MPIIVLDYSKFRLNSNEGEIESRLIDRPRRRPFENFEEFGSRSAGEWWEYVMEPNLEFEYKAPK